MKPSINLTSGIFEAAKQRVSHEKILASTDKLAVNFLKRPGIGFPPSVTTDNPLSSIAILNYLRDIQFIVQSYLSNIGQLRKAIRSLTRTNNSMFSSVENSILEIDSALKEKEIKIQDSWDRVSFNTFSQSKDMASHDRVFSFDPKTRLPFLDENEIKPFKGNLTLPIRTQEILKPMSCQLVSDETDFGDTSKPLLMTDPFNCFLKDKVFRFLTLRKLYSPTTQRLLNDGASLTLLIDFGIAQKLNAIEFKPASSSVFQLESIEYLNQSNETVELIVVNQPITTAYQYFSDVIYARYVKIKFFQKASVALGEFTSKDSLLSSLQETMKGSGFITGFDLTEETLEGFVYDFSIRSIIFRLITYERLGGFIGQPIKEKAAGIDLVLTSSEFNSTDSIRVPNQLTEHFHEAWVGIKSEKYESVVPIPSKTLFEHEKLELIGPFAPLRFFPDLRYGLTKTRILRSVPGSGIVTLTLEDNILVGTTAGVWGTFDHDLNGYFPVVSQVGTTVVLTASGSNLALTPDTSPYFYIYDSSVSYEPFEVYQNTNLLSVGTDYKYSLDGGETWLSSFNVSGTLNKYLRRPLAGDFRIRLLGNTTGIYWCSYRRAPDQLLSSEGKVELSSGVLTAHLEMAKLFPIVVLRSNSEDPYLTDLVTDYSLRVRNVS